MVSYLPTFFRVATSGLPDQLALGTGIKITFDATLKDASGDPSPSLAYSAQDDGMGMGGVNGFTPVISNLSILALWMFIYGTIRIQNWWLLEMSTRSFEKFPNTSERRNSRKPTRERGQ